MSLVSQPFENKYLEMLTELLFNCLYYQVGLVPDIFWKVALCLMHYALDCFYLRRFE